MFIAWEGDEMPRVFKRPGRPSFFESPEELQDLFKDYVMESIESGKLPNMSGFRANKAISRDIVFKYEAKEEYKDTFDWMKDILEDETLNNATVDSSTKKLVLTNRFGYKDKQEVDQRSMNINVGTHLDESQTREMLERLKRKYLPESQPEFDFLD